MVRSYVRIRANVRVIIAKYRASSRPRLPCRSLAMSRQANTAG